MRKRVRHIAVVAATALGALAAVVIAIAATGGSEPALTPEEAAARAASDPAGIVTAPAPTPTPPTGPAPGSPANDPPPRREPVVLSVDGQRFTVPAVVPKLLHTERAHVVAMGVAGRSYLVAPSARSGDPCFIEVPDDPAGDPVMGCDPPADLRAKGGWLIDHQGSSRRRAAASSSSRRTRA
jgi:hypothetical protein